METQELARRVAADIEDVLGTIPLVQANEQLTDRLFEQLVDLLLEQLLVDLRADLVDRRITAGDYARQLARLADQCQAVGLLHPEA